MSLLEARVNAILQPTTNQKKVLTTVKAAATPQTAAAAVDAGINLITARDMLVKQGLLSIDDNGISLTNQGEELLQNFNLADATGLTPEGQKFVIDGDEDDDGDVEAQDSFGLGESVKESSEFNRRMPPEPLKIKVNDPKHLKDIKAWTTSIPTNVDGRIVTFTTAQQNSLTAKTVLSFLRQRGVDFELV